MPRFLRPSFNATVKQQVAAKRASEHSPDTPLQANFDDDQNGDGSQPSSVGSGGRVPNTSTLNSHVSSQTMHHPWQPDVLSLLDTGWFGGCSSPNSDRSLAVEPSQRAASFMTDNSLPTFEAVSRMSSSALQGVLQHFANGNVAANEARAYRTNGEHVPSTDRRSFDNMEDESGVGLDTTSSTWAGRQYLYTADLPTQNGHPEDSPFMTQDSNSAEQADVATSLRIPKRNNSRRIDNEEDAVNNWAWRFRFSKKWQAAQAQQWEPAASQNSDMLEETLNYMHTGGEGGWNMQFGVPHASKRTASQQLPPSTLQSMDLSSLLEADADDSRSSFGTYGSGILSKFDRSDTGRKAANRALEFMNHQQRIDAMVDERWMQASSSKTEDALGEHIMPVQIDNYGRFPFVLLQLDMRNDAKKWCVRGRNYFTVEALTSELTTQVHGLASQRNIQRPTVEELGRGTLAWRLDAERHLVIVGRDCVSKHRQMTSADVCQLTAAMLKKFLPFNYTVSIDNKPVAA